MIRRAVPPTDPYQAASWHAHRAVVWAKRAQFAMVVAVVLIVAAFVLLLVSACGPKDEHRERCERQGGTVGTQYDHNHNVKAHTCLLKGKVIDVWSMPAPTPEPRWH